MIRQSLSRLCGRARVRSSDSIRSTRRSPRASKAVLAALEPLELRRLLSGTAYTQSLQITEPGGGAAGNAFGLALATHGPQALIASPGAVVDGSNNTGKVYLVDTTSGSVLHTFTDPDPNTFDQFGASAAFIGDRIAIGATSPNAADNDRIFLYQSADDASPIEIVAPDTADGSSLNGFAASLTTDGTYLYAGQSQTSAHPNGVVFQYDAGTGLSINSFQDDALLHGTGFGLNIAVSSDTVYTSATDSTTLAPVVLAFDKGTGAYVRTITEPTPPVTASGQFGVKLATAPNGDLFVTDTGAVFQFDSTGAYIRDYTAPDVPVLGPQSATFGASIAFNDLNQVIIGARTAVVVDDPVNPTVAQQVGGAFVFDYTDGSAVGTVQQVPTFDGSSFNLGTAVAALPDGKVLVSDPLFANDGAGAVYVYAPASTNTAPSDVAITGQADAARLQTISFAGTFSDPDVGDTHTFSWDFDDGSAADTSGLNVTHAFATEGIYTVTLTVTDSQQASASATFVVNVAANSLQGDVLYVGGTAGSDSITIASSNGAVTVNGTSYAGANSVVIYAGDGNDNVTAYSAPSSTTLEIYGGAGDDSLFAGGANDIIVGGDGDDLITGGKGRDILIGGWGSDTINGDQNDDILIASYTVHDNNPAELESIFSVWNDSDSYDARVAQLESTTLRPDIDVLDDGIADTLKGAAGTDFFSFNVDQDTADVKHFEDATTTTDPAPLP